MNQHIHYTSDRNWNDKSELEHGTYGTLDVRILQDQLSEILNCAKSIHWIFVQLVFGFLQRFLVQRTHVVGIRHR